MNSWKTIWSREASEQRLVLEGQHARFESWIKELVESLKDVAGPQFQDVSEGFGIFTSRGGFGEEMRLTAQVDFAAGFFYILGVQVRDGAWRRWPSLPEFRREAAELSQKAS